MKGSIHTLKLRKVGRASQGYLRVKFSSEEREKSSNGFDGKRGDTLI